MWESGREDDDKERWVGKGSVDERREGGGREGLGCVWLDVGSYHLWDSRRGVGFLMGFAQGNLEGGEFGLVRWTGWGEGRYIGWCE